MGVRTRTAGWRAGWAAARAGWRNRGRVGFYEGQGRLWDQALNAVPIDPELLSGGVPEFAVTVPPVGLTLDPDGPRPHFSAMCHTCASGGDWPTPQRAWAWAVGHAQRRGHTRYVTGTSCHLRAVPTGAFLEREVTAW